MSRFPKHTETFIVNEMIAVEELGVPIEVYPLLREREAVIQPQAVALVERAHYQPFLSLAIVAANGRAAMRNARLYGRTLLEILSGTWGSINFLFGALGIFPKAVYFAETMIRENITHIHAHFSNHPVVAALVIHRLTGIPFSFTAHGHDIHVTRVMLRQKVDAAAFASRFPTTTENLWPGTARRRQRTRYISCTAGWIRGCLASDPLPCIPDRSP